MTLKQFERRKFSSVTKTSHYNVAVYYYNIFACWETRFLPLHVSKALLKLICVSFQVITIRSPSQTARSQHVTLYLVLQSCSWFFEPVKSYKSYSCINNLQVSYQVFLKDFFKSAVFLNSYPC